MLKTLKKQAHFDLVNKLGVKIHSKHFILVLARRFNNIDNGVTPSLHFGMKVGRKLGGAVVRNKIKRRLRSIVRFLYVQFQAPYSVGMIIVPRNSLHDTDYGTIKQAFIEHYTNFLR